MASAPRRLHSFSAIAATAVLQCAVLQYAAPAAAQWLNYPNPGVPRTADGKPNLSAATPKMADGKPDLSGVWIHQRGQNQPPRNEVGQPGTIFDFMPPGSRISYQPWAEALYKERIDGVGAGRPSEHCLPHGVPDAMLYGGPMKIVQTPPVMIILFEELSHFRQVYTDGRGALRTVLPAWYGYSSGKWAEDTLVVETTGFSDQSWLDDSGLPHTDAMRTIETFRRRDVGHMDVKITIDDPKAFTKPFSVDVSFNLAPNMDLLESLCENEKDVAHIGK